MQEPKPKGQEQSIDRYAKAKESLGSDGHFVENAVALIVDQAATIRALYPRIQDAMFAYGDAVTGKRTKIPTEVIDNLTGLSIMLNDKDLAGDAMNVGLFCTPVEKKGLDEANKSVGVSGMRKLVLNMCLPHKPGEQPITLAARIQASVK